MLTRWGEIDSTFAWMDELRRRMDQAFQEFDQSYGFYPTAGWPRANLYDSGSELVLKAEVPGLLHKDLNVTINQDVLTISGERASDAPQGYSVHRQERTPVKFSRSFSLPTKVDPEKVGASLREGMLTIRLSKVPEAQPRQITVKVS
jgi:HSP20 family protein